MHHVPLVLHDVGGGAYTWVGERFFGRLEKILAENSNLVTT